MSVAPMSNESRLIRGFIEERAYAESEIVGKKIKIKKNIRQMMDRNGEIEDIGIVGEMIDIAESEQLISVKRAGRRGEGFLYSVYLKAGDWNYPVLAVEEISV